MDISRRVWKETRAKGERRYYYVRVKGAPVVTVCVIRISKCSHVPPQKGCPKPVYARGISACHPTDDPPCKAQGRVHAGAKADKAWFHQGTSLATEKQDEQILARLALLGEEDSAVWKQMKKGKILGLYGAKLTATEKKRFPDWARGK